MTMYLSALKTIMYAKGLSQADIARAAGVSRQTVSRWFRKGFKINLYSNHLEKLALSLEIQAEDLTTETLTQKELELESAALLWDRLFPDIESFALALVRGNKAAL